MPRINVDIDKLISAARDFRQASDQLIDISQSIQNSRNNLPWDGFARYRFDDICSVWESGLRRRANALEAIASDLTSTAHQLSLADHDSTRTED
jgi:uncharacterized protein YukE